MSVEETKIFDASNKSMQDLVQATEETLKELDMSVKTLELDKTLMESHGTGPVGKAIVTVYREANKAYIRLKHNLDEPEEFWDIFSQYMSIFAANPEEIGERAKVVQKIIDNVKSLGAALPEQEAWEFIYKFLRRYKRNPEDEEVNQIAISYVEMLEQGDEEEIPEMHQEPGYEDIEVVYYGDEEEEEVQEGEITPEEALREIIREMETLTTSEKNQYLGILPDLSFEQQKMLVSKIRQVDEEMNMIPYLTMEEREALREQIMRLPKDKRQKKIGSIIKKREKRITYYQIQEEEERLKNRLEKIPTISKLDKEIYQTSLQIMDVGEKERFIKKLEKTEELLNQVVSQGHELSEMERKYHRDDLLRMENENEMEKYIKNLVDDKKIKDITEELMTEIPQLTFEEESRKEKLIKELVWLSPEERKGRIEQLKKEIGESSKKRDELFSSSSAGNTCPKCGWIVGKWSKKCPRCGHNLSGW